MEIVVQYVVVILKMKVQDILELVMVVVVKMEIHFKVKEEYGGRMNAKDYCEICKGFGNVMFTDCGLICEGCWNQELRINDWNYVIDKCVKILESMPIRLTPMDCAKEISLLKKKVHTKAEIV